MRLKQKFGNDKVKKVVGHIEAGDLEQAAGLLLEYYDKSYKFSQNKYKISKPSVVESDSGDPEFNAVRVLKKAEEIILNV